MTLIMLNPTPLQRFFPGKSNVSSLRNPLLPNDQDRSILLDLNLAILDICASCFCSWSRYWQLDEVQMEWVSDSSQKDAYFILNSQDESQFSQEGTQEKRLDKLTPLSSQQKCKSGRRQNVRYTVFGNSDFY